MANEKRPLGYLGGDIMSFGSNLARQYEYDKFLEAELPVDVYSPVQNKSINDKSNVTEEQNNRLAEKITAADIERLWNSDFAVMCTEQSAIGTMCEMGCLFGWKYMADRLMEICQNTNLDFKSESTNLWTIQSECHYNMLVNLIKEIQRIANKNIFAHYFDIRTNHLNEKDWRRSFSINQLLYGMILACTTDHKLHENFDSVLEELKKLYGEDAANE